MKDDQQARATDPVLLSEMDLAARLKLSPRTLQSWRLTGNGPKFVKISSKAVRYRAEDVMRWTEGLLRQSTSEKV